MHEGKRTAAESLGPLLGHTDTSGIGGDDSDVVKMPLETIADVIDQYRHGDEVVDRTIKEALGLGSMQIDRHDAVGAGGFEQIEDQTAGDGFAAAVLFACLE